ncbi:MAG: DUF4249 domain-containing protein [Bacteroidota bacterium]|nr:DUF4249 domain-containing protein [Bacteroidota bacterium]
MNRFLTISFILFLFLFVYIGCKKPYSPPAISVDNKFLVIDGSLVNSADSPSVITLSRTVKLTDTTQSFYPETGATVSVEDSSGGDYVFFETPNGMYKSPPLSLNSSDKYRLKITTASGDQYASDYVQMQQTPPIDTITWQQQNDVSIYLNTHDPSNITKYYRWDYVETWQNRSPLESELGVENGFIYYVTDRPLDQKYNCWSTDNSTEILIGSSVALNQDVINLAPIALVPQNSVKINIRYSILVKQYAITEKAYQYFQILKKNTENLGSIFDAQPTQLVGNIHSVKNPSEIVIGYFTASSVQQKRIFIDKSQVTDWNYIYPGRDCDMITIEQNPANYLIYNYPDPDYSAYYFSGMTGLVLTRVSCVDCTLQGGANKKPSYW